MRHLTLPIDPKKLQSDERLRNSFIEMFGSDAYAKAVDPDAAGGYDYTSEEIAKMSDKEFAENWQSILEAAAKGRVD